jgi:hypothetical protein
MVRTADKVFQMRATEDWLRRLDDWRRAQIIIPSRAEAIRRLVEVGLEASSPAAATKPPRKTGRQT